MKNRNAWLAVALLGIAPAGASAQDPAEPAAPVAAAAPAPVERDGARVLGRLGLGTFRRVQFDLGSDLPAVPVDSVGLRYWFNGRGPAMARAWGVDLGVAFAYRSDTVEVAGSKAKESSTAVGFHGGLPLVLAQLPHANFEVVPEVDVVVLGGSQRGADLSGVALGVDARAGFEVFFGFIGLSDLSLEASVAVGVSHVGAKLKENGIETSRSVTFVGFQKLDDPWDIFRTSVAARYYF